MGSLLMFSNANAQTCTPSPSCTSLGYTKTKAECGDNGIKCPFGELWSCNKTRFCAVGWIYYEDGSCVPHTAHNAQNKSKVALGVVVYVNPNGIGGQVMSPWPIDVLGKKSNFPVNIIWALNNNGFYDISSLSNYTTDDSAKTDDKSCSNTDKILADTHAAYPVAQATRKYAPTTGTKGKWCLPAAGVMASVYENRIAIRSALYMLGGLEFQTCCMWSSSEYSGNYVWISNFSGKYGLGWQSKDSYQPTVRPVLEF